MTENEAKALIKEIDFVFTTLLEHEAKAMDLQMICRNLIILWMELGEKTETTNKALEDSIVRPVASKSK